MTDRRLSCVCIGNIVRKKRACGYEGIKVFYNESPG